MADERVKILVIDDEISICRYFERILPPPDYTLVTAQTVRAGLDAAQDPEVQLILTDYNLDPSVPGMQWIQRLRLQRDDIPLAVLSGSLDDTMITTCEELGVTHILPKPFTAREVTDTIKSMRASSPNES